jgi:hypothetical protein
MGKVGLAKGRGSLSRFKNEIASSRCFSQRREKADCFVATFLVKTFQTVTARAFAIQFQGMGKVGLAKGRGSLSF